MAHAHRRRIAIVLAPVALVAMVFVVLFVLMPVITPYRPAPTVPIPPTASERDRSRAPRTRASSETDPPSATDVPPVPAPPAAESTYPLKVTVLRSDGTPAPGATVLLVDPNADDDQPVEIARVLTDASGVGTPRAPEGVFRAAAWFGMEACATSELVDVKTQHEVTLRLGPAVVPHGRVFRGGTPEPGAEVELTVGPWHGSDFGHVLRTKSDGDGRFAFPPVELAGVDKLNPPHVEALTLDRARGFAVMDLENPELDLVVELEPGFSVRGRFLDADRKPVRATIWAVGARRFKAQTDADGRIEMRLCDAAVRFVATRRTSRSAGTTYIEDFDVEVATESFIGDSIADQRCVGHLLGDHADGAGDVDLGDVVLAAGKPLKGQVADAGGAASPRAEVQLFLAELRVATTVCDADGRFELPEVSAGPHTIHVREIALPGRRGSLEPVHGGDAEVKVVLDPAFVVEMKFLSDGDRKPVSASDVHAEAFRHGTHMTAAGTHAVGEPMNSFALDVRQAGSYDVRISVAGFEPVKFDGVDVVADRPLKLDVLLRKKRD